MLTVLVTCLLMVGEAYTPQPEWKVTKVHMEYDHTFVQPGTIQVCTAGMPCSELASNRSGAYTHVYLTRIISPGEKIDLPKGCQVVLERSKEDK